MAALDNTLDIKVNVDMSRLETALEKTERLVALLERARELSIAVSPNSEDED